MRNLKKMLALVLALVMSLSLVTIASADFSDAADIDYTEAVEVMAAAGILQGDGDKFNPKGTLTREEAAKIITFVLKGAKEANKLSAAIAPFADVAADRWSAGAIAFCSIEGIIDGAGDGNFYPTSKLTGAAFAKMLLCALGFDADEEGLTGAAWALNTAKLYISEKLDTNLDIVLSDELTREQAAQMALNAMVWTDAAKVWVIDGYTNLKFDTQNDAILYAKIMGESDMTKVKQVAANEGTLLKDVHKITRTTGTHDSFGRPATQYAHDDWAKAKVYTKTADFTFNKAMKEKEIFAAVGAAGIQGAYDKYIVMDEIYINGKLEGKAKFVDSTTDYWEADVIVDPSDKGSAENTVIVTKTTDGDNRANGTGNGVTVELFKTDVANHYVMVAYNEFVTTVSATYKADENAGTKRYITLTGEGAKKFETESFKTGDTVLYTKNAAGIASVKAPETISGKVTKITSGGVYTIGGLDVKLSQDNTAGTPVINTTGVWYVDSCGNIIKAKSVVTTEWNYGYLLKYQVQKYNAVDLVGSGAKTNEEKFQIITSDGTKVVYDGAFTVNSSNVATFVADAMYTESFVNNVYTCDDNMLVRYTLNADGKINKIEKISEAVGSVTGDASVASLVATKDVALLDSTKYVNDKTIFIAYQDDTHYSVYVGYKNIPATITANAASSYFYAVKADGTCDTNVIAAVVLPVASAAAQTTAKYAWFASTANYSETTADGTTTTYTDVYLDGVKGTLTFKGEQTVSPAAGTLYYYSTDTVTGYATLMPGALDSTANIGKFDKTGANEYTRTFYSIVDGYFVLVKANGDKNVEYVDANTKYFQVDSTTLAVTEVEALPEISTGYDIERIMVEPADLGASTSTTNRAIIVYFTVVEPGFYPVVES